MSKLDLYRLTSGWLLAAMAAGAQAIDLSATTDTVKGREPVAAPNFTPASPLPGDNLTVSFFSDADGDAESGSVIQWFRNGAIMPGATNAILPLDQSGIGGSLLSVRVTPKTDPAITDPSIGHEVTSAQVRVGSRLISNFLILDGTPRTWSEANSHCQERGARLPTIDELQQLFMDATVSPTFYPNPGYIENYDMCDVYGWPLPGLCGGTVVSGYYWSNTPAQGCYKVAIMTSGQFAYTFCEDNINHSRQAACTR